MSDGRLRGQTPTWARRHGNNPLCAAQNERRMNRLPISTSAVGRLPEFENDLGELQATPCSVIVIYRDLMNDNLHLTWAQFDPTFANPPTSFALHYSPNHNRGSSPRNMQPNRMRQDCFAKHRRR